MREEKGTVGEEMKGEKEPGGEGGIFLFLHIICNEKQITCHSGFSNQPPKWGIFLPFTQWMGIKANAAACQELKPLSRVAE